MNKEADFKKLFIKTNKLSDIVYVKQIEETLGLSFVNKNVQHELEIAINEVLTDENCVLTLMGRVLKGFRLKTIAELEQSNNTKTNALNDTESKKLNYSVIKKLTSLETSINDLKSENTILKAKIEHAKSENDLRFQYQNVLISNQNTLINNLIKHVESKYGKSLNFTKGIIGDPNDSRFEDFDED